MINSVFSGDHRFVRSATCLASELIQRSYLNGFPVNSVPRAKDIIEAVWLHIVNDK